MSEFPSIGFRSSVKHVKDSLWLFPGIHGSLSNASWWIDCKPKPALIDCPEMTEEVIHDLKILSKDCEPIILLTSRDGHGKVSDLSKELGWPVLVQEQESYLLPDIQNLSTFSEETIISSGLKLLWTPGPSPGSCVVYAPTPWNVLFCGRLLIPVAIDEIKSIRTKNTFHWPIQEESLQKLIDWIPQDPLISIASACGLHLLGEGKLLPINAWHPNEN